jgi:transposase
MISEIGDKKRFPHPRQLASWIGMDIREYSSGGKHNRFGITKQGRTAFVEANQRGYRTAKISQRLKARRKNTDAELVSIADRCLKRLNKKGNHLLIAGKRLYLLYSALFSCMYSNLERSALANLLDNGF